MSGIPVIDVVLWWIVLGASALTIAALVYLWRKPQPVDPDQPGSPAYRSR